MPKRQQQVKPDVIDDFKGEYAFLSNFYPVEVKLNQLDSLYYPTVEHAYQAAKTTSIEARHLIRTARSPAEAKQLGRRVHYREGWDDIKISIMLRLLRRKFDYPWFADLLQKTGEAELIEGNYWGDDFWGVYKGQGQNHLGELLMQVRSEL